MQSVGNRPRSMGHRPLHGIRCRTQPYREAAETGSRQLPAGQDRGYRAIPARSKRKRECTVQLRTFGRPRNQHLHLTIYVQQRLCHGRLDAYLSGRKPYQPSAAGKSERTVRQSRPAGSERQYRTRNLPGIHRRSLLLRNDPPGRTEAGRKRLISLQDPPTRSVGTERHGGRGTNGSPASHRCLQPDPSAQPL